MRPSICIYNQFPAGAGTSWLLLEQLCQSPLHVPGASLSVWLLGLRAPPAQDCLTPSPQLSHLELSTQGLILLLPA